MIDINNLNNENINENRAIICPNTYMKKQDFLKMIDNLPFVSVKSFSFDLITGFLIDSKEDTVEPKGFLIEGR